MKRNAAVRSLIAFCLGILSVTATGCSRTPQQRQADFLERGRTSLAAKDYSRAILEFKNAIKANPQEPEPYYQLALAALALRDFSGAVAALQTVVRLNPKHFPAQLKLAELMTTSTKRERLEEAEQRIQEVLTNSPEDPEALNALALTEFRLGKQKDAEGHLLEVFDKSPHFLTAGFNLVRLKLNKRDFAGAEAALNKVVEKNPASSSALNSRALFYVLTRRPKEAERSFHSAIAADPKNGAALVGLAELLQQSGNLEEAERLYSRAAALPDPEYKAVHAIFLYVSGKRVTAINEFEALYKANPTDRDARARLIAAYQADGRSADAEKLWWEALKKNPRDIDALLQRSRYYVASRKHTEAEADLNMVLRFQPDSAQGHYLLSKVRHARGEGLIERQELTEAVRYKPEFLEARIDLARLLIGSNAAKSALDLLEAAPASQKNTLGVVEYKSWAQLALGDKAAARKGIDRALAATPTRGILLLDATFRIQERDASGARKSIETALKRNPADAAALDLLVQSYAIQNQITKAVPAIQKYASENPKSPLIQHFLAQLLLKVENRSEAHRILVALKATDPKFVPGRLDLAQMDLAAGSPAEAVKELEEIVTSDPTNLQAHLLLGAAEETRKNFAEAVGHYRKALELDDRNMMALNNLAYILAEYGKVPEEALKLAERAGEVAPNNPSVQDTTGWVLYRKGMYSNAVKYLEQADSKQPSSVTKLHLGSAYIKIGDRTRGVQMLHAAMALDPKVVQSDAFREITAGASIQ